MAFGYDSPFGRAYEHREPSLLSCRSETDRSRKNGESEILSASNPPEHPWQNGLRALGGSPAKNMTTWDMIRNVISRGLPVGVLSRSCAPVLTYHACFDEVPESVAPIDNITPHMLYEHLHRLKKGFRFV